jgi:hypothetical protein
MSEHKTRFERSGTCLACGREFEVSGTAANPGNETEAAVQLRCSCGGELAVFLPGSVNRESLVVASRLTSEE